MIDVELPALTGDSPLGILAAIGVLRLLEDFADVGPALRWERGSLTAVVSSSLPDTEAVASVLEAIVGGIAEGSVLPGVGPGFPPPGAAPDGLRVPQSDLGATAGRLLGQMGSAERDEGLRWIASLITDLVCDTSGRAAISQFTAPSGKQSMSTMLDKPLAMVRDKPKYLRQALEGWRRVPGVTGENLDHRAMWEATEDGAGKTGQMRGVPGATWLALMSYPVFRTTASTRKRPLTSGWHTLRTRTRTIDELRLPVWESPIGTSAVTALVEHPVLALVDRASGTIGATDQLEALGIIHVCRARRHQPSGSKSAGVLTTTSP